jgi:uncharacterized protein (TIGR03435 family)
MPNVYPDNAKSQDGSNETERFQKQPRVSPERRRGRAFTQRRTCAIGPNGAISLFDAVRNQLGVKLEKERRPVPVLVIDHIEEQPPEPGIEERQRLRKRN